MPTGNHTDPGTDHGWGWLDATNPIPLSNRREPQPDNSSDVSPAEPAGPTRLPAPEMVGGSARMPTRAWVALAVSLAVSATLICAGILTLRSGTTAAPEMPSATAAPPPSLTSAASSTSAVGSAACSGLSGDIITDTAGDPATVTGVIAAFEHAYYRSRDAVAALRLTAPEAGLDPQLLAAGITSIPADTRHCVAITSIADHVAEVHLVEVRPDGQRRDYLQVINVRREGEHMLITNIQKRG
ncbi:hypothetical protein ACFWPH_32820 [Nocardia sp. NPDC058499]|uniref:hypothetical protein n=1 Tax=Nocardia sp. NPDC058499 TaxID=3346530 RepID=UPI0036471038